MLCWWGTNKPLLCHVTKSPLQPRKRRKKPHRGTVLISWFPEKGLTPKNLKNDWTGKASIKRVVPHHCPLVATGLDSPGQRAVALCPRLLHSREHFKHTQNGFVHEYRSEKFKFKIKFQTENSVTIVIVVVVTRDLLMEWLSTELNFPWHEVHCGGPWYGESILDLSRVSPAFFTRCMKTDESCVNLVFVLYWCSEVWSSWLN